MQLLVKMLIIAAYIANATPATADALNTLTPTDRANLISAAAKLREAILHVDLRTVVSLVSGLRCTDTEYNKAQIRIDLSNVNSVLYQGLFNAPSFSHQCGAGYTRKYPATSEKAFFETTPNGRIEVELVKGDYATVKFISPKSGYYPREYTFKKEGTNWMLVDGLVIGSCTCG